MQYHPSIPSGYGEGVVDIVFGIAAEAGIREGRPCVPKNRILYGSRLAADVGFDSLDHYELLLRLEDELGVPLPPCDEQENIMTVGDAVSYVGNAMRRSAQPATA